MKNWLNPARQMSIILLGMVGLLGGTALAQQPPGAQLYIRRGCLGCHGASGRGGVGPDLSATKLSLEDFRKQVRTPRGIMPPFPLETIRDEEVRSIYEYAKELPPPPARLRADLPSGVLDRNSCAPCHRRLHPAIVRQFESSAMGVAGKQNPRVEFPQAQLTCADCHGTNHDTIMASKGRVPETTCGTCHAQIFKEHVTDKGHSYGPGPGNLGINWERNISVPHYSQMPRKVMEMGCDPCHAVAGATADTYWDDAQKQYKDTSSLPYRNGCIGCHTRHSFSMEEARKPEACFTCHMGPDHPNYEAYMSSKHGSIYAARGESWNWRSPIPEATWDAPTCAYCHMLRVGEDGSRSTSHNMSDKVIWGMGVQAAGGQLEDITVKPENRPKREAMIGVCMSCHSEDKARGYLSSADAHKLAGDALVVEARQILSGLYQEGLIEPGHGRRSAGLLPGPQFTAIELPLEFAQHWPAGLYYDVSSVELEYFDLFFFANLKSYKGAFHMSPDYSWWYGYADALGRLARIRDDAAKLREAAATQSRTLFMLATGPIMVLAVLGAVYGFWRLRRRDEGPKG